MKKLSYLVAIIVASIALIFSTANLSQALSSGTLTYNGASKAFTYSGVEQRDFFDDFKDLIPGDQRSQTITVRTVQLQNPATMFLSLDNFMTHTEIYQYLDLVIDKNGETIFDSRSDANESLIELHHFTQDESFDLTVDVSVPIEVGNEISDLTRDLKWTFYIEEETPKEDEQEASDDSDNSEQSIVPVPRTFDNSHLYANLAIFVISLALLIYALTHLIRQLANKSA